MESPRYVASRDLPTAAVNGRCQYLGLSTGTWNDEKSGPRCCLCEEELLCLPFSLYALGRRFRYTACVNKQCDTNDGVVGWYIGYNGATSVYRGHLLDWYNKPQHVPVVNAQTFTAAVLPWKVRNALYHPGCDSL